MTDVVMYGYMNIWIDGWIDRFTADDATKCSQMPRNAACTANAGLCINKIPLMIYDMDICILASFIDWMHAILGVKSKTSCFFVTRVCYSGYCQSMMNEWQNTATKSRKARG